MSKDCTDENNIIEETIKVFQPYSKEPLTKADALEIHQNFTGFFELLLKLDKKIRDKNRKDKNES
jgi:hypothetical protein